MRSLANKARILLSASRSFNISLGISAESLLCVVFPVIVVRIEGKLEALPLREVTEEEREPNKEPDKPNLLAEEDDEEVAWTLADKSVFGVPNEEASEVVLFPKE